MLPSDPVIDPLTMMEVYRVKAESNLISAAEKLKIAIDYIVKMQQMQEQMREQRRGEIKR